MREKEFIRTLTCLCVVIMACGTAFAQQGIRVPGYKGAITPMRVPDAPDAIFYSNLTTEVCSGCLYDAGNGGFVVFGPNECDPNFPPGTVEWLAYRFIANHTGPLTRASVAITQDPSCTTNPRQFTLGIWSDNCVGGVSTGPLAPLASANVNAAAAPCALATARFPAGTTLTQGVTYWIVATTSGAQNGFTGVWWFANPALNYFNQDLGTGPWLDGGGVGGFSVQ